MANHTPCCQRRHTKRAVRGALRQAARLRMRDIGDKRRLALDDLEAYRNALFGKYVAQWQQHQHELMDYIERIDAELVELARVVDGSPEGEDGVLT